MFTFPVAYELWNIYLSKFVKRYVGVFGLYFNTMINSFGQSGTKLERARDLFEQALEKCPAKLAKPLFLMYAKLEEDYGLAKRSMTILERATQALPDTNKFEVKQTLLSDYTLADTPPQMYAIYIAKATANYGLPATRPIYQRAIEGS